LWSLSYLLFFKSTTTTHLYTLSLHDALPICSPHGIPTRPGWNRATVVAAHDNRCCGTTSKWTTYRHPRSPCRRATGTPNRNRARSEEHTSELQSRFDLVCRLLLEKKK